jgi:hypothetical protein
MAISRGHFSNFSAVLDGFGSFWSIFGRHFSLFRFFWIFRYGILARRIAPCTIGHRKRVLKRANWAPKVATFHFVDLGIKPLVLFTRIVFECSRDISLVLVGPTSSTHHSSARGGGLDTLFPPFFTLFWVAK